MSGPRGGVFRYRDYAADADRGVLTCRYELDGREFTERVTLPPGERWHTEAARAAARLVFLLAGVSYYKTAAPPVIDLGETALTGAEEAFLRDFYLQGLGEFAYRNNLDLSSLSLEATRAPDQPSAPPAPPGPRRALVPFGGGIDSIVTVEQVRRRADVALFVVSRPADRFDAIEQPAAVTGLPVVRAEREIDPQLLRSAELGFLNGHVPVTGILSAIAVLAAVLEDRDAVVMSNEWSASVPTLEYDGRPVNHQYSKSEEFEAAFRGVLADSVRRRCRSTSPGSGTAPSCGWGGSFAKLRPYHASFRSCNKAFYTERARRFAHWCGQCDKCCFHRPDPRALPAGRGAPADLRGGRRAAGRPRARGQVPVAARRGRQAVRVRRRGHRVPGGGAAGRAARRPRRKPACCRNSRPRWPAGRTRRPRRRSPPCSGRSAGTSSRTGYR